MKVSEYVSLGHPDKTADYISEYILDRLIEQDPKTRYGLEVQVKDNYVTLGGEITTNAKKLKYKKWVKEAIEKIGYTHEYAKKWGKNNCLDASKVKVATHISKQSHDIAIGVDEDKNQGWGDQGQFWGYASNDKSTGFMGAEYYYAKILCTELYNWLLDSCNRELTNMFGLDIKTQITTNICHNVEKVVVAIPTKNMLWCDIIELKVKRILNTIGATLSNDCEIIINGTGSYIQHSSFGDCGTTGRKLAVDMYGGDCVIGGGSMATKDGTKADLTLNMYAREVALKYSKKLNTDIRVCIGCCIGRNDINIAVYDSKNKLIADYIEKCNVKELIEKYKLNKPIFADLCEHGYFSIIDKEFI